MMELEDRLMLILTAAGSVLVGDYCHLAAMGADVSRRGHNKSHAKLVTFIQIGIVIAVHVCPINAIKDSLKHLQSLFTRHVPGGGHFTLDKHS